MMNELKEISNNLKTIYSTKTGRGIEIFSMKPWEPRQRTDDQKSLDLLSRLCTLPENVCAAVTINEINILIVAHNKRDPSSVQHIQNVVQYTQNLSKEKKRAAINSSGILRDEVRKNIIHDCSNDRTQPMLEESSSKILLYRDNIDQYKINLRSTIRKLNRKISAKVQEFVKI